MSDLALVAHAQQLFRAALDAVDPARLLDALALDDLLPRPLSHYRRRVVLGVGKAGLPFAAAIERQFAEADVSLDPRSFVVVPAGYPESLPADRARPHHIRVVEAAHPVPDGTSIYAAQQALEVATGCTSDDLLLVLISGGGSALWAAPADGLSLGDVQTTTRLLLRAGADIHGLNAVRKHLSRIKGGRLAAAAAPATMCALVLSDVVGDDLSVIASGPTVPDPTTYADARAVLQDAGVWSAIPEAVRTHLHAGRAGTVDETPSPEAVAFRTSTTHLIGNNDLAVRAAADAARQLGYHVTTRTGMTGEARDVGRALAAAILSSKERRPAGHLWGGETTVTVTGDGCGGRNQEVALGAARDLVGAEAVVVLAAGTDGVDGPTDAAGAWSTPHTVAAGRACGYDAESALQNNDAYPFFDALGQLLQPGPTHTNVMDLYIALRGPVPS